MPLRLVECKAPEDALTAAVQLAVPEVDTGGWQYQKFALGAAYIYEVVQRSTARDEILAATGVG